jgi:argininosuccinate synthase
MQKKGFLEMGVSPLQAPDKPTYVELEFEKGASLSLSMERKPRRDR